MNEHPEDEFEGRDTRDEKPKRDEKRKHGFHFTFSGPGNFVPPRPPMPPQPGFTFGFGAGDPLTEEESARLRDLSRLHAALISLTQTLEHSLLTNTFDGTQQMVETSYRRLYERAKALLGEDELFVIPAEFDCPDERTCLTQMQLAARQLAAYVDTQMREMRQRNPGWGDLRNLGRQLSDQILSLTKGVIGRAMADIEIDIDESHEGENFMGADLSGKTLVDGDFENASFVGANLSKADATSANFEDANFSGANLREGYFVGANFENATLAGVDASQANLGNANLEDANLSGARLNQTSLEGANLEDANLRGVSGTGTNFQSANLEDANLTGANLTDASFEDANCESAVFTAANLTGAHFRGANLEDAVFKHSNLTGVSFEDANLTDANFTGANLNGVSFAGATLDDTTMPDGRRYRRGDDLARFGALRHKRKGGAVEHTDDPAALESWEGAQLRGADLRDYTLSHQNAARAVFTQANLQGVKMTGGNFMQAVFIGANLREVDAAGANFEAANLAGAMLMNANLQDAHLLNANLGGANLTGASLTGAVLPDGRVYEDGIDLIIYGAVAD